jgi:hypothetical protein
MSQELVIVENSSRIVPRQASLKPPGVEEIAKLDV